MELSSKQVYLIEKIYEKCDYDKNLVIEKLNEWYDSLDSTLRLPGFIIALNISFSDFNRRSLYDLIVSHVVTRPDQEKLFIAIPDGNGMFLTLVRSSSGHLIIGDKRYRYIHKLKEHNSYIPGGITVDELSKSGLAWCLQFAGRLEND